MPEENLIAAIMNSIHNISSNLSYLTHITYLNLEINKCRMLKELQGDPRYRDPKHLVPYGYKMYSQNEEDGIIREIFKRIGTTNRIFVELGVGNGLENNTLALLFEDWKGLWIEGSSKSVDDIRNNFAKAIGAGS